MGKNSLIFVVVGALALAGTVPLLRLGIGVREVVIALLVVGAVVGVRELRRVARRL